QDQYCGLLQEDDGIRVRNVTGDQKCDLAISPGPSVGAVRSSWCSDPSGASCELRMELRFEGGVVTPGSGHRADADGAFVIGAPALGRETIGDTIAHIGLAQLAVLVQRHQGVRGLVGVSGPEVERAVGAL